MNILRLLTIILVLSGCVQETPDTTAFFCPEDQCEERIIALINGAEDSIEIAIYSFTSPEIAEALINAKQKGVEVRVVADYLQSASQYSQLDHLQQNGIEVRIMPETTMHNKFMVIDNKIVETGSFNFTENADTKNNENIAIIFERETARLYSEKFFELWIEAG